MAKQLPCPVMHEIFTRFHAAEAEPKGVLVHVNACTLVVALSAHATDAGVNKAKNVIKLSRKLVKEFDGKVPSSRA